MTLCLSLGRLWTTDAALGITDHRWPRRLGMQLWTTDRDRSAGDDLDRHRELDVGVEADRHGVCAETLDRVTEQELSAIEIDPGLLGHRVDHIRRRDRAEQTPLRTGLGRDGDDLGHEPAGDLFGRRPVLGVTLVPGPTHGPRLGDRSVSSHHGELLRKQVVAGVAARHLADIASLA